MPSTVYYMNDRASYIAESIPFKALKLCRDAGIATLFKPGDKVAIKVHMGEYATPFNLRPHWVKAIVEEVQRLGGEPYVVDCSTIVASDYSGRAVEEDHLRVASSHGFNQETLGCPVLICDGAFGFDDVKVPVPHGVFMKHTWIGKRLLDFDACIVVSHFKGHAMGVYGGALKNVGIGMGSKHGKLATHFYAHPGMGVLAANINQDNARAAANAGSIMRTSSGNKLLPRQSEDEASILSRFLDTCPRKCYSWDGTELHYDQANCSRCGNCITTGRFSGILQLNSDLPSLWPTLISDAAAGYINAIGKDKFLYVNYAFDITPYCDCNMFADRPMMPNLGVFVSRDPVAVDMASLEACEAASIVPGSRAEEYGFADPNTDRFTNCSSPTQVSQWSQINAAVYNGIGSSEYVLVESEPGPETDFWFPPYTPENSIYKVHKEDFAKDNFVYDEFYYEQCRMDKQALYARPAGIRRGTTIREFLKET